MLAGTNGWRPTPVELLARAECWRPGCAYAALQLWAALAHVAGALYREPNVPMPTWGRGPAPQRCASAHGLAPYANTHVSAHRCDPWERLRRATVYGAASREYLPQDAHDAHLSPFLWLDSPTGLRLSPVALLAKRAALVPLPRTWRANNIIALPLANRLIRDVDPALQQP